MIDFTRRASDHGPRARVAKWLQIGFCSSLALWSCSALSLPGQVQFGELPQYDNFKLNSSGDRLLYLRSNGDTYDLIVRTVSAAGLGDERKILPAQPHDPLLNWCQWANTERVVCSVRSHKPSGRIGKVLHTRLIAVNFDGSQRQTLVRKVRNTRRRSVRYDAQLQDGVMSWLPNDPEHILLSLNRHEANRPGVYRLNLYTNVLSVVRRARGRVHRWYADSAGEVRMALGYKNQREPVLFGANQRELRAFPRQPYSSEIPPAPLLFDPARGMAYMNMTNGEDRHGIYAVDIDDGTVRQAIHTDPDFDVFGRLITDRDGIAAVRYLRHVPTLHWFNPVMRDYFETLNQQLPGTHLDLMSSDANFARLVVQASGGIVPSYHYIDRRAGQRVALGKEFSSFNNNSVVDLKPITYPSRDGQTIPAYLALPKGAQNAPVPMILFPHSGPYARDSAVFDYWTQFFLDRGYGVLKPNYRGSVGYGQMYMRAGFKQWGLRMQEDLIDGLTWLEAQGVAKPNRACVVGASYGGYTALVAAYKFAEEIQCAVSMAGVADLESMVQRIYNYEMVKRNRDRIQSSNQLRENSPVHQASRMSVPLLLVHGDLDTVVDVGHSRRLAKELTKLGKSFSYVEQTGGDHFLSRQSQRAEFFEAMATFLDTHLQVSAQ